MTARTAVLATPKRDFLQFPDRRSVYWVDEEKGGGGGGGGGAGGEANLTPRQIYLSSKEYCNILARKGVQSKNSI